MASDDQAASAHVIHLVSRNNPHHHFKSFSPYNFSTLLDI
jgi:hypothetical protein